MTPFLRLEGVVGGYAREEVVRGVSLDVRRGDFIGIIGPNGSGKSTLLKLMTRFLKPWRGTITLEGEDAGRMEPRSFARKVAFVPQDTWVQFPFTVEEIVLMGRIPHLGRLQSETKKDFALADAALGLTGVSHLKGKEIDQLSAGERQRVIIARALVQEPSLLLLDEPTSHLDIGHQIKTLNLLRRLNRDTGLTIVIVLHDLNLAGEYCHRLVMMTEGRVFAEGTPEQVLTYENVESVYKTVVVVRDNPISSKPYVIVSSRED